MKSHLLPSACALLLCAAVLLVGVVADVSLVTREGLAAIFADVAVPSPWIIRFYLPFDPQDAPSRTAFHEASMQVPPSVGRFGEFPVDSLDNFGMVDAFVIPNIPSIILCGCRIGRAAGQAAGKASRLTGFFPEYRLNSTNPHDIAQFFLANVPARYADRVTNTITDSVHYIFSKKEMYAVSQRLVKSHARGEISALPSRAILFFLDLTNPSRKNLVAALSSSASQSAGSVIVFATADEDVAARFKLPSAESAASFAFPLPADSSEKPEVRLYPSVPSMLEVMQVVAEEASLSASAVRATQNATLAKWAAGLRSLQTSSPLRKLSTTDQFIREVIVQKTAVTVVFLLRESDEFFNSHLRTAVELAAMLRRPLSVSSFHTEVFWLDAEAHPAVAAALKAKTVPAIAVIFSVMMQGNQPGKAAKYFEPPKKGEWPTAAQVVQFLASEQMTSNAGLFTVDPAQIVFSPLKSVEEGNNRVYIATDFRTYPESEEKENTFVNKLISGQIKHEERAASPPTSSSSPPLSAKKLAKKKKKEEAERARLQAELEKKQRDKEERIRKKAADDATRRAESAAQAKLAAREDRKRQKEGEAKGNKQPSVGGDEKRLAERGEHTFERPKFHPGKPPKDRHAQHEHWKSAMKEAIKTKKYIFDSTDKPPKIQILHTLEFVPPPPPAEKSTKPVRARKSSNPEREDERKKRAPEEAPKSADVGGDDDDGAISDE